MIVAYFTENEKYLQKDDYKKSFDVSNIAELVSKVRVKEPILIKAKSRDIFDFKYNSHIEGDFDFEILSDTNLIELNETIVKQDLKALYDGITDYVKYSVKPEWQNVLGKIVYLVKDRELQRNIVDKQDTFAFMPEDLSELVEGLKRNGEIPQKVLLKCFFDGREIEELHHEGE